MIVAIGGGELGGQTSAIDDFIVRSSGKASPRVLFFPTAAKDAPGYTEKVVQHFGEGWCCEVRGLSLLANPSPRVVAEHLAWAEVVYVGGGDTNLLVKTWNRYGLGPLCLAALDRGVVLAGISAGAICWFDGGLAAYNRYKALPGLGIVPGLVLPHFEPGNVGGLSPWFDDHPTQAVFGVADGAALTWDRGAWGSVVSEGSSGVWKVTRDGLESFPSLPNS